MMIMILMIMLMMMMTYLYQGAEENPVVPDGQSGPLDVNPYLANVQDFLGTE